MTTAVVSGTMVTKRFNGGEPWVRLSWIFGLSRLGLDVFFIEQIDPGQCVDETGAPTDFGRCANLATFKRITEEFGLEGRAVLLCGDADHAYGMSRAELLDLADATDLLINITGQLTLPPLKERMRHRVYIDEDPGFTQIWLETGLAGDQVRGHDFYFTVGENIGQATCSIPSGGIPWRPIRQPVVLDHWPPSCEGSPDRFTTVGNWRGVYDPIQYGGKTFGLKVHEFRKFIELPERVPQTFEIALGIHPNDHRDLAALRRHGWHIVDPSVAVPDPGTFRRYVQTSGAEFSVAQGMYVDTGSGWFSDRTVRYLASGKPALVQQTGWSRNYPAGEGLLSFSTMDEAIAGAESITRDYDRHSRAARSLAQQFFDSDVVLGRLLEEVGVGP